MRAGRLRKKITIEQGTETQNSFGEPEMVWSTFATRQASIEPLSGDELFQAKQVAAETSIRVRLRYLAGVTPKMRVTVNGRTLNIENVINIGERNRELQLICSEMG